MRSESTIFLPMAPATVAPNVMAPAVMAAPAAAPPTPVVALPAAPAAPTASPAAPDASSRGVVSEAPNAVSATSSGSMLILVSSRSDNSTDSPWTCLLVPRNRNPSRLLLQLELLPLGLLFALCNCCIRFVLISKRRFALYIASRNLFCNTMLVLSFCRSSNIKFM
nr:MAG: hypothetical protein [Bee densovirus 4]